MVTCNRNRFTCLFHIGCYIYTVLTLHISLFPVTALEALTGSATPSAPLRGLAAPARGQLWRSMTVASGQVAVRALCGDCFPLAQELHSSSSPWPLPFLEPGCSCDPTDLAALCCLCPRPGFSPQTCPPVTELLAEQGFCYQTSLQSCGTVPHVHDSTPACLAASLGS